MPGLLSKLSDISSKKPIEPREIFMSLPQKNKHYEYPRDVQSEVWKKWFPIRDHKNCIIKMNTGSGKTVVGLIILQSCLNEGKGPAAYVVPDNYLVSQVCAEAEKLGIKVTDNRDEYLYSECKSILVMPIQALVNGKSVFGMRPSGNYPLGSVLIDDVHACLDTITAQFSLKIPASHDLYKKIVAIFSSRWKEYNPTSYTNIVEMKDPTKNMLIPFWMWQASASDVFCTLSMCNDDQEENKDIFFSLPLLEDNLKTCNCIITSSFIEITPAGIAISKIKQFEEAKRRIFMSATLSDDSVFISSIGLHENDIQNVISPDDANDLGDRLILFPRHLNNKITNEDIRDKIITLSEKYNIVVIVPSRERARFWDEAGQRTVTKENIKNAVFALKDRHIGVTVFVNRYDGIDLPDDACRMLVIDGLPPLNSEYDKYVQSVDASSSILLREQIQRIEQGIGRGVRSNSDSCCIVLMGDNLADVLVRNKGTHYFSSATMAQYTLSKELWDLLKEEKNDPTVDDVFELAEYSLNRNLDWIQQCKERLSRVSYECKPKYDKISVALRKAFEFSCLQMWTEAADEITKILNTGTDISESTKGYLLQIKAGYVNFINQAQAQEILLKARTLNAGVLSPIVGIQHNKLINNIEQARAICEYAEKFVQDTNGYILHLNSLLSKLVFSPRANDFETALAEFGKMLGFLSTRPDIETHGAGPDNLWAVGNGLYYVIECKSGSVSNTIAKNYCNQLGGSVRWFRSEYGQDYTCKPIIVHNSSEIDDKATPVPDMRIMTDTCIEKLKKQVTDFAVAVVQNGNWLNEEKIGQLLELYHLRGEKIWKEYTVDYKK